MDKISIPKLRRKPKPPAIETSTHRHPTVSNDSINLAATVAVPDHAKTSTTSPKLSSRMSSPFRRLRGGKRARSSSPASGQLSEPVAAAAAVTRNGTRSENGDGEELPRIKVPAFLTQSDHELQLRFQEIQLQEHQRVQHGLRGAGEEAAKWSFYRPTSTLDKGTMDRYANIRPWNHNRVALNVPETELDYVNASAVAMAPATDAAAPTYRYIAMQGPTEPSFDYVWRMVAEQTTSPAVIVQLTTMLEGDMRKCGQYFPFTEQDSSWTLNQADAWNDAWAATLTYDSMDLLCDGAIERRKLLLHVAGEDSPRTVWHFLYLRWPDFGAPALTDIHSFFELMRLSREHAPPLEKEEPRIVHCSAGVGRTGTFICLEHLMRELEMGAFDGVDDDDADTSRLDAADLVYETVDVLRQQRRCMVQSVVQYVFVYQVMRKLWGEKYGVPDVDAGRGVGALDEESRRLAGQPASKRLEMAADLVLDDLASTTSTVISEGETQDPVQDQGCP